MKFSEFGEKFRGNTGIGTLMHDLAAVPEPPADRNGLICRLGGGNPAHIPEAQRTLPTVNP